MTTLEARKIGGRIQRILANIAAKPMFPSSILNTPSHRFDFSKRNREVESIDMAKRGALQAYVDATLAKSGRTWGFGGYGEDRSFYRSPLFTKDGEPRTVHLGVDVWLKSGTPISVPIAGRVHSFQINKEFLDYGPTIILEHNLSGVRFSTLYGHLSTGSLSGFLVGKEIPAGAEIARLGTEDENGNWAPHLHFQIIGDLLGKSGDYPAVAKASEQEFYLALCPDPNLLLRLLV